MTKLNRSEDRNNALRADNKAIVLNNPQDRACINRLNEFVVKVKSDFQIKDKQSQIAASKVILTS